MASLIPKIKIGLAQNRKEKHNLSFDCSTTANIGNIQPTMCREMVPQEKFKVKVSSLVRLASMPLPSFGRISLRHYHSFIPYIDLWQPFDALMSGQHYVGTNVASFIPSACPTFTMHDILQFIIDYSNISIAPVDDIDNPYTITTSSVDWAGNQWDNVEVAQLQDLNRIVTAWNAIRQGTGVTIFGGQTYSGMYTQKGSLASDDRGVVMCGSFYAAISKSDSGLYLHDEEGHSQNVFVYGGTPILSDGADLITKVGDYALLFKFKAPLKRLRQIFIGLGYQFSPYNTEDFNPFKLMAYYKGWFSLFRPNRELAFVDTNCYRLIKKLSEKNGVNARTGLGDVSIWDNFISDLMLTTFYYLPQDYYSMSVLQPGNNNQDSNFVMNSGAAMRVYQNGSEIPEVTANNVTAEKQYNGSSTSGDGSAQVHLAAIQGSNSPMTIKLALRMLQWANKNTVIGRSVREYLKVHFGITDTQTIDDDAVYRIGSSRTNVQISDVMSTAENEQGYLGEYGGKGIGFGDSETFDFTADKFGVWITYTVVVPESGYYQGYLKENRHFNRYQFFNNEYDAMGYQVLERGEVMDDYSMDGADWNPRTAFQRTKAFGFVPRYSEYKVGRNIVNGDLSIPGMAASMAGYTIDRRLPHAKFNTDTWLMRQDTGATVPYRVKKKVETPDFVPSVIFDNFRRIDPSDHLGQYNRIFNVVTNDVDHFIIHAVFDVTAYAPMKSLSNSFDTITSDDDGSIDVTHS